MKYISSRNNKLKFEGTEVILRGIAPDGGLFMPESVPKLSEAELKELFSLDYIGIANRVFKLFLPEFSDEELIQVCENAYLGSFEKDEVAPLRFADEKTAFMELYHGPSGAFKDVALQALPHFMSISLKKAGIDKKPLILVATSGDTGKAALEGFADVENIKIAVFYPEEGVSDIQKKQMQTQKGNNVAVFAVEGNFDDAQSEVKRIFASEDLAKKLDEKDVFLSSANSINWGRLLPQIVYYFSAYSDLLKRNKIQFGEEIVFCVPSGNFGNILAGYYAKLMGLPIKKLVCASNKNNVLTDFFKTGIYDMNRPFYKTSAPSMDILLSSNLERLLYLASFDDELVSEKMHELKEKGRYELSEENIKTIKTDFEAYYLDETDTSEEIESIFKEHFYLIDSHTAIASGALKLFREESGDSSVAVVLSTASPYKFAEFVLSSISDIEENNSDPIGRLKVLSGVEIPEYIKTIKTRPLRFKEVVKREEMKEKVLIFGSAQ